MIKSPPLPCATVPVNFASEGTGRIAFDKPVKVSAANTAGVPDRIIPIQGPSCEARVGQGKFKSNYQKNAAGLKP
jgi:hypothetical protein